jgi:transcription initiation factor TFIIH subunit 1
MGSSDDMFSRYHQKLLETGQSNDTYGSANSDYGDYAGGGATAALAASTFGTNGRGVKSGRKWGTKLAVGQFDLAATFATERGDLLEGPKDNHPPENDDETNGMKVIQKYNRHWAMVLNPEDVGAGSNLLEVARKSINDTIPDDDDAKPGGGFDAEMQRLVGFANSSSESANHALGIGESDDYETLTLKNIDLYIGGGGRSAGGTLSTSSNPNTSGNSGNKTFAARLLAKMNKLMNGEPPHTLLDKTKITFPDPKDDAGKMLLLQLTKKMDKDSRTEADTLEIVNALPEDFKKRLHSYFRRSSELLRHFFGLRRLMDTAGPGSQEIRTYQSKMAKIKNGMETVHSELYDMRQKIEGSSKESITMRRMCDQILDQLGHAFNLATDATNSGGGGGGFEVVDILGN